MPRLPDLERDDRPPANTHPVLVEVCITLATIFAWPLSREREPLMGLAGHAQTPPIKAAPVRGPQTPPSPPFTPLILRLRRPPTGRSPPHDVPPRAPSRPAPRAPPRGLGRPSRHPRDLQALLRRMRRR